jgi:hypothetical protein
VNDAERLSLIVGCLVRCVKTVQDTNENGRDDRQRNRSTAVVRRTPQSGQRFSWHVLHYEKEFPLESDDVECANYVWVSDPSGKTGFVQEHRYEVRVLRKLRVQALDRYGAREAHRAEQAPDVNGRHTARGNLVVKGVTPEYLSLGLWEGHHLHQS